MNQIQATWTDGHFVPDEPIDLPEGARVRIEPLTRPELLGLQEEDAADAPENVKAWLTWYDSLEPLLFTREEMNQWEQAKQAQKDYEKARFMETAEKLQRSFE